jgi:catechol 2,3-dioxygenase-like lactoylglutathione lyase family enzyme
MDNKPAIVAPATRHIRVADAARSILFYRDVLGFEVRDQSGLVEAVYGPARIQFGRQDCGPNDWNEPRPQGSAILFFQTDDVEAMHAAIRARGGTPSEMEKVNWIKMRMFEIRDPDGHTLWFGQSYDVPHAPGSSPMMWKALPELPFDDVATAVAYYRDVLGFRINYQQHDLGVMDRDDITVLLIARTERHTGIGSAYVYVANADTLYAELRAKGAKVQGEPVSHPWGLRDFRVLDLEGNWITFGQPFE